MTINTINWLTEPYRSAIRYA